MLGGVCNSAANGMLQGFNMSGIANSAQQLSYKFRYFANSPFRYLFFLRMKMLIHHLPFRFPDGFLQLTQGYNLDVLHRFEFPQ